MKDYYPILGVDKTASDAEIKSSYRKLARKHHPDRGGDTSLFQEIQEAYSVLGNPKKRKQYDSSQQFGVKYGDFGNFHNLDPEDIFNMFTNGSRSRQSRRKRNLSMTISLWVSLEDVAKQDKKIVSVSNGNQINSTVEHVEIDIPPALEDDTSVRYPKILKDERDLIVKFKILPSNKWTRNDLDLMTDVSLSIWELILGTSVTIETIHGTKVKLTIPPRTQPQTKMRIGDHGLRDRSGTKGDMFVKINGYIPESIPEELQRAIRDNQNATH